MRAGSAASLCSRGIPGSTVFYLNSYANLDNFGTFAPIIVFMLWTYVSSIILIMGAELSSEFGRLKQGVERGTLIHQREP